MTKTWNNPSSLNKEKNKDKEETSKSASAKVSKKKAPDAQLAQPEPIATKNDSGISENLRQEWKQYKIKSVNLIYNGLPTQRQLIVRDGEPIEVFTDRYQLLPNQEMLQIADKMATVFEAKPAHLAPRDWFYMKPKDHVIYNKDQTQCAAIYLFDKKYEVAKDDFVKLGFVCRNSIDGTTAFSVAAFDFRTICQNMMMHIASAQMFQNTAGDYLGLSNVQLEKIRNHQTQTIAAIVKKHTKKLQPEFVQSSFQTVIEKAKEILKHYREMTKLKMTQEKAQRILDVMPTSVSTSLNWLEGNYDTDKWKIKKVPSGLTDWEAFNSITETLTKGKKLSFKSTLKYMKKTDQIFLAPLVVK